MIQDTAYHVERMRDVDAEEYAVSQIRDIIRALAKVESGLTSHLHETKAQHLADAAIAGMRAEMEETT